MNNKLIFRTLGALASALIIVSVFIPFINTSGQSLWEAYKISNTLYLPIMIISFGGVGLFFFSINVKTEFAYSTSGAIIFFIVSQTITFINKNQIGTLGVGYYCLATGAVLTALMAFICNIKSKKSMKLKSIKSDNEISVLERIDKLYNNQNEILSSSFSNQNTFNMTNFQTNQSIEQQKQTNNFYNPPLINPALDFVSQPTQMAPQNDVFGTTPVAQPVVAQVVEPVSQPTQIAPQNDVFGTTPAAQPVVEQVVEPVSQPTQTAPQNDVFGTTPAAQPVVAQVVEPVSQPTQIAPQNDVFGTTPAAQPVVEQVVEPVFNSTQSSSQNNSFEVPIIDQSNEEIENQNVSQLVETSEQKAVLGPQPMEDQVIKSIEIPPVVMNSIQLRPMIESSSQSVLAQQNPVINSFNVDTSEQKNTMFSNPNNNEPNNVPNNVSNNLDNNSSLDIFN